MLLSKCQAGENVWVIGVLSAAGSLDSPVATSLSSGYLKLLATLSSTLFFFLNRSDEAVSK